VARGGVSPSTGEELRGFGVVIALSIGLAIVLAEQAGDWEEIVHDAGKWPGDRADVCH
jgi:hypothetical protein